MAHVVAQPCVGCKYTDCVVVCPVDCFYGDEQQLYIDPDDCLDCEACVPECPVEAIFYEGNLPAQWAGFVQLNADRVKALKPLGERVTEKQGERQPRRRSPFAVRSGRLIAFPPPEVHAVETRREFNAKLLGSLMTFGLVEMLWSRNLFAEPVKPTIDKWLLELVGMSKDLKTRKLTDLEFQAKMEDLYKRVDLKALCSLVKLDDIEKKSKLPDNGAASLGIDLSKVEGLPKDVGFGRQIFGCKKGRSVVPHGHENMCTGFIILKGTWSGKHYDKVETHKDHYVIKPTIDRKFEPGELSTISDHKDNVHWFKSESDAAYIFNVHVTGYDSSLGSSGRLYLDPDGEKLSGGLVKAPKMTSGECHKKYG